MIYFVDMGWGVKEYECYVGIVNWLFSVMCIVIVDIWFDVFFVL